jgi:hypothetical protein
MLTTANANKSIEFWDKYGSSAIDKGGLTRRADFNLGLLLVMERLVGKNAVIF